MENEVKSMHRQKIKLKTKNMVLKGQKAQINRKIKQLLAKSEVRIRDSFFTQKWNIEFQNPYWY